MSEWRGGPLDGGGSHAGGTSGGARRGWRGHRVLVHAGEFVRHGTGAGGGRGVLGAWLRPPSGEQTVSVSIVSLAACRNLFFVGKYNI